jgi:hypothetical protein
MPFSRSISPQTAEHAEMILDFLSQRSPTGAASGS